MGTVINIKCLGKKDRIVSGRLRLGVLCILAILGGSVAIAAAQTINPHRLYEQRCSGCHAPHAGQFVSDNLIVTDGKLIGRKTGREVRAFLEAGHGKLTPAKTPRANPLGVIQ